MWGNETKQIIITMILFGGVSLLAYGINDLMTNDYSIETTIAKNHGYIPVEFRVINTTNGEYKCCKYGECQCQLSNVTDVMCNTLLDNKQAGICKIYQCCRKYEYDTCYRTCYEECYETCYETCYQQCIQVINGTISTYSCNPYECRPFKCRPHKCRPYQCDSYSCNRHCIEYGDSVCEIYCDTCYKPSYMLEFTVDNRTMYRTITGWGWRDNMADVKRFLSIPIVKNGWYNVNNRKIIYNTSYFKSSEFSYLLISTFMYSIVIGVVGYLFVLLIKCMRV